MGARFRELDGLRGIAAFAVLVYHFTVYVDYPADDPAPFQFVWGEYGVQLFFLISGFVILMTAQRAKRPADFVISRLSRLYPAYWFAVVVASTLALAFNIPGHQMRWWERVANLTMVQRWFLVPNVDLVYWTLAIEMQFYVLLFALLLLTKCRITPRVVLWAGLSWVLVGLLIALLVGGQTRGIAPSQVATPLKLLLNATLAEQAPLFVGGMFAYLGRECARFRGLSLLMGALAVLTAALVKTPSAAAAVAVVVTVFFGVVNSQTTRVLLLRPVQFYGRISYTLYIQHAVTGMILLHLLIPVLGRVPAMLVAAVIVTAWAWLAYEIFEVRGTAALKAAMQRWLGSKAGVEGRPNSGR